MDVIAICNWENALAVLFCVALIAIQVFDGQHGTSSNIEKNQSYHMSIPIAHFDAMVFASFQRTLEI